MGYYDIHIFVCENNREPGKRISCGWSESGRLRQILKEKIKELVPDKKIRVNMSGCLDRCEEGPVQVLYPEGKWFCMKSEKDIEDFINFYIIKKEESKLAHISLHS